MDNPLDSKEYKNRGITMSLEDKKRKLQSCPIEFRQEGSTNEDIQINKDPQNPTIFCQTFKMLGVFFAFGELQGRPCHFNSRTLRLEKVNSKWRTYISILSTISVMLSTLTQGIILGVDYINDRVQIGDMNYFLRVLITIIDGLCTLLYMNDSAFIMEVIDFTNKIIRHSLAVANDRIILRAQNTDRIGARILKGILGTLILMLIAIEPLFWIRCEANPFANVLPICRTHIKDTLKLNSNQTNYEYESGANIFMGMILMSVIAVHNVCSGLTICATFAIPVFGAKIVLKRLIESTRLHNDRDKWRLHYTCVQLLFNRANVIVYKYLAPLGLLLICTWTVFLNYSLIKFDLGILITTMILVMYVFLGIASYIILHQAAFILGLSGSALDLAKRRSMVARDKYYSKWLNSRQPVTFSIGSFFKLGSGTSVQFWEAVIDWTVNLLLTF